MARTIARLSQRCKIAFLIAALAGLFLAEVAMALWQAGRVPAELALTPMGPFRVQFPQKDKPFTRTLPVPRASQRAVAGWMFDLWKQRDWEYDRAVNSHEELSSPLVRVSFAGGNLAVDEDSVRLTFLSEAGLGRCLRRPAGPIDHDMAEYLRQFERPDEPIFVGLTHEGHDSPPYRVASERDSVLFGRHEQWLDEVLSQREWLPFRGPQMTSSREPYTLKISFGEEVIFFTPERMIYIPEPNGPRFVAKCTQFDAEWYEWCKVLPEIAISHESYR